MSYYSRYNKSSGTEKMPDQRSEKRDWRDLFSPEDVSWAQDPAVQASISRFSAADWRCDMTMRDEVTRRVSIWNVPLFLKDTWQAASFQCSCPAGRRAGNLCRHMAAALVRWEKQKGGEWIVWESPAEYHERKEEERIQAELERRERLKEQLGNDALPAAEFFKGRTGGSGLVHIDMEQAVKGRTTTAYAMERARDILRSYQPSYNAVGFEEDRKGEKSLRISCVFEDLRDYARVGGKIRGGCIDAIETKRSRSYYYESSYPPKETDPQIPLDEFQLAALWTAWEYLDQHEEKNQVKTDDSALTFFAAMEKAAFAAETAAEPEQKKEKRKVLQILPRIIMEDGRAQLSFKIGKAGSRLYIVRNMRNLAKSYTSGGILEISKKESIDFSQLDMIEEDKPLADFIVRRVGEIGDVNAKLAMRAYGRAGSLSVGTSLELTGSLLDGFYDVAQGRDAEYQDKTNRIQEGTIRIGHRDMRFELRLEEMADARGSFAGIVLTGLIPVQIHGSMGNYTLNSDGLSRISRQEEQVLRPFRKVADPSGYFRFCVGRDSLQEFYYRVLPALLENPCVILEDLTQGTAQKYLPPEPAFTFYLDYEEPYLLAHTRVRYDDKEYIVEPEKKGSSAAGEYHDLPQERRVLSLLSEMFDWWNAGSKQYVLKADDQALFAFLTSQTAKLAHYGELRGTDAFRRLTVRPMSAVQVGISVESGLMDLTVTSRDLSPDELIGILESYRKKKRYHRLSGGTFVDLTREEGTLSQIEDLLAALDLPPENALRSGSRVPLFRALYLDRLLEEHDALASARDRTYRALIRSFRTIRDAEYELPSYLEDTLRPYQSFGFKWLKTLQMAGFGGILADEMGLGKTVQTIALFLSDQEMGCTNPSMVVCPASLVYNWEEEIRRFAPTLRVIVMAGTLSARKKLVEKIKQGEADVTVVSYDTLKRDIALYRDCVFRNCVLDEAQYIKNPKAAVSKAVKVLQSEHRFALTGTPIENRLSELWSIFDYLMPGFLYSMNDFQSRFEQPIVREKDAAATQKLKKMTGPFVLRRCKSDVLKDLPAKLEEVRYARIGGEQQRIYDAQVVRMKKMLTGPKSGPAGEERIKIFAELTRIRQICCDPSLLLDNYQGESAKREAAMELIRSAMDGGHRMLLFSQFTSMLALLEEDLKKEGIPYYLITGATSKEKRISLVHAFNEGDVPIFLISLKAGGNGLNLTGADVVIHYDPWWNLAVQNQATDRAHRIGQTRQVTVYRLILKDTIEEKILQLQDAKKDLADAILEGRNETLMSLSNEELLALLE